MKWGGRSAQTFSARPIATDPSERVRERKEYTQKMGELFSWKRPDTFISRRTQEFNALSFCENMLGLLINIPAVITGRMKIGSSDRRTRVIRSFIFIVSLLNDMRVGSIEPRILEKERERFIFRWNEPAQPFGDY